MMKKCHVCGSEELSPWCPGLLECGSCTHVQADIELSDVELAELYGHKYFHGEEYVDYALEREALDLNFARRLSDIRVLVPPGARLFEIGCAYGYFLQTAVDDYQVAGCDISEHAISQAQQAGLDVVCADYLEIPAPEQLYEIICMWDTIEHLTNPKGYVEKAFTELAPGGLLVISTGDAGSRVARFRRENWRMVHPPTHLHYFTSGSMNRMLDNAGFANARIAHHPFYRNVASSLSKTKQITSSPIVKGIAASLQVISPARLSLPVNLYDIMTVYARK